MGTSTVPEKQKTRNTQYGEIVNIAFPRLQGSSQARQARAGCGCGCGCGMLGGAKQSFETPKGINNTRTVRQVRGIDTDYRGLGCCCYTLSPPLLLLQLLQQLILR